MVILCVYLQKIISMSSFIGMYECKIDARGRIMFPAALRKQLQSAIDEGFVLKRSVFHKCLELYPMAEWKKQEKMISKLNRFKKRNNDFIRMFMAGVKLVDLDSHGRIQVAKDLVNYSGLEKNIVIASSGNIIEVWDKVQYEGVLNDPEVDFGALAEDVMGDIEVE